jgi:hypothetical protein
VPAISGDNVVSAYGSYTKIGTARVKVSVCAKQTGTAFAVGAVAYAYSSSGASKNIGAVVLTGSGTSSCVSMTFLLYRAPEGSLVHRRRSRRHIKDRTDPDPLLTWSAGSARVSPAAIVDDLLGGTAAGG